MSAVTTITAAADREAERAKRRREASIDRAARAALRAVPHADITARGRELARLLNPYIGTTATIQRTCSLIARLATRYYRLAERECSEEMTEREAERVADASERIEARVRALVASLPPYEGTVRVRVPGRERDGNTWGLGGEFGV